MNSRASDTNICDANISNKRSNRGKHADFYIRQPCGMLRRHQGKLDALRSLRDPDSQRLKLSSLCKFEAALTSNKAMFREANDSALSFCCYIT